MIKIIGSIVCTMRGRHNFGAKDRGRYGKGEGRHLFKGRRCRTCGTLGVKKASGGLPKGVAAAS